VLSIKSVVEHMVETQGTDLLPEPLASSVAIVIVRHDAVLHAICKGNHHLKHIGTSGNIFDVSNAGLIRETTAHGESVACTRFVLNNGRNRGLIEEEREQHVIPNIIQVLVFTNNMHKPDSILSEK